MDDGALSIIAQGAVVAIGVGLAVTGLSGSIMAGIGLGVAVFPFVVFYFAKHTPW